jgi:hypothetical protein
MTLAPLLSALHARSRIDEALEQVRSHAYIERAAAASDVDALAALEKSIAALLAAQDTDACAMGARAAALYVAQGGWAVAEVHAAAWLQRILAQLDGADAARAAPLVDLARVLMGCESPARPEYHRVVVAPMLAKIGVAVISVLESSASSAAMVRGQSRFADTAAIPV